MSEHHEHEHHHGENCHHGCCNAMDRRDFLSMTSVGVSALAASGGLLGLTTAVSAGETATAAKPRVRAVFLRPDVERTWMGWPGACYDMSGRQAEFTKIMTEVMPEVPVIAFLVEHNRPSAAVAEKAGLSLVHRAPDAGNPDPAVMRLVYADRPLSAVQLATALR